MQSQYGWNLLQKPLYFPITKNVTQISLAALSPEVRKVKLHVSIHSYNCVSTGQVIWSFSTKIDIIKIVANPYNQNAITTYSDNCAIRLDERKIIEISRIGNDPDPVNFALQVEVLGYK